MAFEDASFWVRMFHLPLACMCETMGVQIRSSVRLVEEVKTEEDGIGLGGVPQSLDMLGSLQAPGAGTGPEY
jgi:hypothetical protein